MRMQTVAKVIIPALLVANSGCAVYHDLPKTALEVAQMTSDERASLKISALTLADGTKTRFADYRLGRLKESTIEGGVDAAGLKIPLTDIAAMKQNESKPYAEIITKDGSAFEVHYNSRTPERIRIITGVMRKTFAQSQAVGFKIRELNLLGTLVLNGGIAAFIAWRISKFEPLGGFLKTPNPRRP